MGRRVVWLDVAVADYIAMNNQTPPNESFELRSDDGHSIPLPNTPRSHKQITPRQEDYSPHTELAHLETLQHIQQPILESSREGGNGSWEDGESSRQQQEAVIHQQEVLLQPERNGGQTYYRIGPNGEREIIHVTAISPLPPGPTPLPFPPQPLLLSPQQQQHPAHFPPSPRMSHPPQKPSQLKSLDNLRNVTQQSFAPSQKTIVLNHIASQMGGVYHSHVSTERMPIQVQREQNTRHSHVHDTRMGSPSRVSFEYAQNKPEIGRNLFSSYIPTAGPPPLPQRTGAASTSNAPQPSERQYQHPEEAMFWREKYEQLGRRWQATRVKETKEQEVAASKFAALEKNYQMLQTNYDQLVQDYHAKLDENQQYYQQIQQLQGLLNQLQLTPKRIEQPHEDLQAALEEKSMLVGLLRKENEKFQEHLEALQQRHEQELREMHEHGTMLQMEVEQREAQLRERAQLQTSAMRRSDNSQLVLDRSRMESFQNTRVMELEMHVGKLNAELNMREESFERQLRMANLNVAELVEKLKGQAQEKDQAIRNLQEKVGLLQSDLNKKDSLIRNLRDEAARLPPQGIPSPQAASVYSSAVNPVDHRQGDREQSFKRELQNIRRSLFQRERQKLILKQKYEELQQRTLQSEEALSRRKMQNQAMRRQMNDLDNLQHENEKLMEVLNKKNAELMEVKEMLMEKEQHAGDFENLSKENDRLRAFMLKKNEELSELAERLYNQEKRAREIELAHTPQLHELEEELNHMEEALARKDMEISKLNQSLELVEGNFSEIQFELERHRNINQEYEAQIRANMERIQAEEEEINALHGEKHLLEVEVSALRDRMREYLEEISHQQQAQADALRRLEEAETKLRTRDGELRSIAAEQFQLREFKQKSTKDIQLIETKHVDLQARCRDLQSLLRNREQRLGRVQREAEEGREQLKKHQSCSKQIEQMSERISHYEMRVISLTLNRSRSGLTDYPPPSEVFENKLIYNLKTDNQALRHQLSLLKADPSLQNDRSPPSSPKSSDIKQRLDQFNNNLQSAIGGGLKRVRSLQGLQVPVAQEQTRQIERLKQLAQEMQRQELEESFSRRKSITPQQLEQLYQEELIFFRGNNLKLEQRVTSLLRINKELKQQLEEAVQHKGASLKTYYEDELRRLEREVTQLRQEKSRLGQSTKVSEKRIRELQQQLRVRRRGGDAGQLSYNFDLTRPSLPPGWTDIV